MEEAGGGGGAGGWVLVCVCGWGGGGKGGIEWGNSGSQPTGSATTQGRINEEGLRVRDRLFG